MTELYTVGVLLAIGFLASDKYLHEEMSKSKKWKQAIGYIALASLSWVAIGFTIGDTFIQLEKYLQNKHK